MLIAVEWRKARVVLFVILISTFSLIFSSSLIIVISTFPNLSNVDLY